MRERGASCRSPPTRTAFALGGVSPRSAGIQSLLALRQWWPSAAALVLAEQGSVPDAEQAVDEMDGLRDPRAAAQLKLVVRKLVDTARLLAGGKLLV